MGETDTGLAATARSIFEDLGYEIAGGGGEFRAIRDWKEVRVAASAEGELPASGALRCVVTPSERTDEVASSVRPDPGYEWAVIGVEEGGEYRVARAP